MSEDSRTIVIIDKQMDFVLPPKQLQPPNPLVRFFRFWFHKFKLFILLWRFCKMSKKIKLDVPVTIDSHKIENGWGEHCTRFWLEE